MPIYEFRCKHCGESFEILTSLSRVNEVRCPACGSADIKRLMSMFASHVGGSSAHSDSCAGCASGHCGSCGCHH